jgi:hypothetical protein
MRREPLPRSSEHRLGIILQRDARAWEHGEHLFADHPITAADIEHRKLGIGGDRCMRQHRAQPLSAVGIAAQVAMDPPIDVIGRVPVVLANWPALGRRDHLGFSPSRARDLYRVMTTRG